MSRRLLTSLRSCGFNIPAAFAPAQHCMHAGVGSTGLRCLAVPCRLPTVAGRMHAAWLPRLHGSCTRLQHGSLNTQLLHTLPAKACSPATGQRLQSGRQLHVFAVAPAQPQASSSGHQFGGGRAVEGPRAPRGPRPGTYNGDGNRRRDDGSGWRGPQTPEHLQGSGRASQQQDWASQQQLRPDVDSKAKAAASMAVPRLSGEAAQMEQRSAGFLAADASFGQLGLSEPVVAALANAGFEQPSRVQALAMPAIAGGQDTVVAAETGSGKTLAYLAPLISALLARNAAQPALGAEAPQRADRWCDLALVLAPNAALCRQVVAAADSLVGADGRPLVTAAHLSSATPPPHHAVDLAVSTPGALHSMLHGSWLGAEWSRGGMPRRMRYVVLDEADLLLSGGFADATGRLLELLRLDERGVRRQQAAWQLQMSAAALEALPYHLRQAASSGGVAAMEAAGYKLPADARQLPPAVGWAAAPAQDAAWEDSSLDSRLSTAWRRQYAFVGATMPAEGKKNVAADLRSLFPDATWLAGASLHQAQAAIRHAWRPVDDGTWLPELKAAVMGGADAGGARGRTLVFARDVAAANEAADFLFDCGLPVMAYHRGVPAAEREAALETLAREQDAVLVATDAAARGLDIPHIAHVVQADFAASAVDFLHRVGRTARAGRAGRVTSLYTEQSAPLADAIRAAIEAGEPIEGAFSRNRSFRKKLKKYGQYVPRGQAGPTQPQQ